MFSRVVARTTPSSILFGWLPPSPHADFEKLCELERGEKEMRGRGGGRERERERVEKERTQET